MNYLFLAAIIAIESSGNPCAIHKNPKIHGATGMSFAALKDVKMTRYDVHCNKGSAMIAAWKYQIRYKSLTNLQPFNMARLHKVGPGGYKRGDYPKEYMMRFEAVYNK